LTAFCVPKSVTVVERSAFLSCESLRNLAFEAGSKLSRIERRAFSLCGVLESVVIPRSVEFVGASCFAVCAALAALAFEPGSRLAVVESGAFRGCGKLQAATLPRSILELVRRSVPGFAHLPKLAVLDDAGSGDPK
jgi:hypothetical protein